jgi:hypothetical protein
MTHIGGSSNPRRENSASHGRAPGGLAGVGAGGEKRDHRGTKNPAYSDVLYVEMLIGPDTISTVPLETLRLFEHHGVVDNTLPGNVARARLIMRTLEAGGIDFNDVNATLEREAIDKFSQSMTRVLSVIAAKRSALSEASGPPRS